MYQKRLTALFKDSPRIEITNASRFVIFSDCHRGYGGTADNFEKNKNLFIYALQQYYKEGFTYIEAGDGDELWENRSLPYIVNANGRIFKIMSKFYAENRLHLIYGNHDMIKKQKKTDQYINEYFKAEIKKEKYDCCEKIFKESVVLRHFETGTEIFILHGNQADFLNDDIWRITRLLVRYLWKPLESVGFRDPTNASQNRKRRNSVEMNLIKWAEENTMLVAGHTHKESFPKENEPLYFNDGSCVYSSGVTCLEIDCGDVMLVKWKIETRKDGNLFVGREVISGPVNIKELFSYKEKVKA